MKTLLQSNLIDMNSIKDKIGSISFQQLYNYKQIQVCPKSKPFRLCVFPYVSIL